MLKLNDIFEVRPDKSLTDLKRSEKFKLMDSVMGRDSGRGLNVDFLLSSSARRTNNRIYTPHGQKAGVDSWTNPFDLPILRNHDANEDPIGRFNKVDWVSLDNEAMAFFKNAQDFMNFKSLIDMNDPEKIYKSLLKRNLLTDSAWPGLGALKAQARILDEGAVEKFLNGTYLTFSAGSHTDRYACGLCGSDWAQDDFCEHIPGEMHDGKPAVFITGAFNGAEASVVNMPANKTSQVEGISFGDSAPWAHVVNNADAFKQDTSTIFITDAHINIGVPKMHVEDKGAKDTTVPAALNTDELIAQLSAVIDQKLEDKLAEFKKESLAKVEDAAIVEDVVVPEVEVVVPEVVVTDALVLPWQLLEFALFGKLGDGRVDESTLEDSSFAGPERVFPVANAAYLSAAEELIATSTFDEATQTAFTDALSTFSFEAVDELVTLRRDYAESLNQIGSLREALAELKNKVAELDKVEVTVDNVDSSIDKSKIEANGPLEDQSITSSQDGKRDKLGTYEQSIVDRYNHILTIDGASQANLYVNRKIAKGHLSNKFDITKFLKEND